MRPMQCEAGACVVAAGGPLGDVCLNRNLQKQATDACVRGVHSANRHCGFVFLVESHRRSYGVGSLATRGFPTGPGRFRHVPVRAASACARWMASTPQ